MLKLLARLAEIYAKAATGECVVILFHEPKMPASLLK